MATRGRTSQKINKWYTSLGDGQRTVTGIILANTLLFCFWRVQSLHWTMVRFFTSNPASKALCSPRLLSMITHFFLFYFFTFNVIFCLFSFQSISAFYTPHTDPHPIPPPSCLQEGAHPMPPPSWALKSSKD